MSPWARRECKGKGWIHSLSVEVLLLALMDIAVPHCFCLGIRFFEAHVPVLYGFPPPNMAPCHGRRNRGVHCGFSWRCEILRVFYALHARSHRNGPVQPVQLVHIAQIEAQRLQNPLSCSIGVAVRVQQRLSVPRSKFPSSSSKDERCGKVQDSLERKQKVGVLLNGI